MSFIRVAFVAAVLQAAAALAADLDRAATLVGESRYQEAYELLLPELDANTEHAMYNYWLGRAALGAGRAEEARTHLARSVELDPDSVAAHLALGRAYYQLGQSAEARQEYEAALAADSSRTGDARNAAHYQAAYEIIAPYAEASPEDAGIAYLLGRAALGAGRAEEAKAQFLRSLERDPDSPAARLALGRAYFALGQFAEARIAFEAVLGHSNVAPDLRTQVEYYDQAARQYLEDGRRLTAFGYAQSGLGGYRINSTRDTVGGEQDTMTLNARVGGGIDYLFGNGYALDANIDYRFRHHDESEVRDDADWRWRVAGTKSLGDDSITLGSRGRKSYRGGGFWRDDYSIFTDFRHQVSAIRQLTLGAEVRRRSYPEGPLRPRSRTTATATAGWQRELGDSGAFTLTGHLAHNYETSRPDGDSDVYGLTAEFDFTLSPALSGFFFVWWESESFEANDVHVNPDDETRFLRRQDDLYEVGGSLIWEFAPGWTFRPEVLWSEDRSNVRGFNFSATEYWLDVRKRF